MRISIIIRTLNEGKYIEELLCACAKQEISGHAVEVIIVDSGSTDLTLDIAAEKKVRITEIPKSEFSFGRSLNIGCRFSVGEILVFISGHCIPIGRHWLANLVAPIVEGRLGYAYGRQVGWETTRFSEKQIFSKYYPDKSSIPQNGYYCNNANSAILREVWAKYLFDEELPGLEDMELAKRIQSEGHSIGYVAEAEVHHIHNESLGQIKRRYEREALALRRISPEIHMTLLDAFRYYFAGILYDYSVALAGRCLLRNFIGIILFRGAQFWGGYVGGVEHLKTAKRMKEIYYYPKG